MTATPRLATPERRGRQRKGEREREKERETEKRRERESERDRERDRERQRQRQRPANGALDKCLTLGYSGTGLQGNSEIALHSPF